MGTSYSFHLRMNSFVSLAFIGRDLLASTISHWRKYSALFVPLSSSPGFKTISPRLLEFHFNVPALDIIAGFSRFYPFCQNLFGNGWLGYDGSPMVSAC
jgi:hypothetical protein